MFEKYLHWRGSPYDKDVWVRSDLKGKHRDHCLCYSCEKFNPEKRVLNCRTANAVYNNCRIYDIVTPVWECPEFKEIEEEIEDG